MLENGKKYKVAIVGSYVGESKEKKTPYIGLELETECGEFIDWVQYLTDGTLERATKTMIELGFIGKDFSDLSNPKKQVEDLFNFPAKILAEIEHETWQNVEGEEKVKAVVKWLNAGGGMARVDHAKSVNIFKGLKSGGMLAQMRKKMGTDTKKIESSVPTGAGQQANPDASFATDDIPF